MQFCPICDNNYDILPEEDIKNEGLDQKGGADIEKIISSALEDKLEEKDIINLDINNVKENSLYKNKNKKDKEIILNRIIQLKPLQKKSSEIAQSNALFFCNNCGHKEKIGEGVKIFSKVYSKKIINDTEVNDDMVYSNILPYTRKYTCINKECPSHKDNSKRVAVIYRNDKNYFKTFYVCVACKTGFPVDKIIEDKKN